MKTKLFFILYLGSFLGLSQDIIGLKNLEPDVEFENILVKKISDDEQQSSFVIWIKHEVRLHKHLEHSENIYILEGKGEMQIGDNKYAVKKGDYFNIPKSTPHGVIVHSSKPMKVLSIQSPKFDGTDRIFLDKN